VTVKIDGFEEAIGIIDFVLKKKINCHSEFHLTLRVKDDKTNAFYSMIDKNIEVKDDDNHLLFVGYITYMEASFGHEGRVMITAHSYSRKTDVTFKRRIFQNPNKKYKDIFNSIVNDSGNESFNFSVSEDFEIQSPVVQNVETDFGFAVRLAERENKYLFVQDAKKPTWVVGRDTGNSNGSIEDEDVLTFGKLWKDVGREKRVDGLSVGTKKYIPFGSKVNVNALGSSVEYVVYGLVLEKKFEEYVYKYEMYNPNNFFLPEKSRANVRVPLLAEVTDNNDKDSKGRIQVKFIDEQFKDMDSDKGKVWITYRTPYTAQTGGIIWLPNKGDTVEVIYNGDSFEAGESVRSEKIAEQFKNPGNKYLAISEESFISYDGKKKSITITVKDGSKANKIYIDGSCIRMEAGGSTIEVDDKGIVLKGKNITVNASEQAEIVSKKIHLK